MLLSQAIKEVYMKSLLLIFSLSFLSSVAVAADVNAKDADGNTALHKAVTFNQMDVVERLVAEGADVNVRNEKGWTPLHLAATFKRVDIARFLLENGANTSDKGKPWSPLQMAVSYEDIDMIKLFIEKGVLHTMSVPAALKLANLFKGITWSPKLDSIIELLTKEEKAKDKKIVSELKSPTKAKVSASKEGSACAGSF